MVFLQVEDLLPDLTLNLVLTAKWFDQVESGEKNTEYREITPYWRKRIWHKRQLIKNVAFSRGYQEPSLILPVTKIDMGLCPYEGWDGVYYRIHFVPLAQNSSTSDPDPILVSNKFVTLQGKEFDVADFPVKNIDLTDDVMLYGCKGSCSSVWCPDCFTKKGGSRRISEKLAKFDYRKTRQVVLTCDPSKFPEGPEKAFEYLKKKSAVSQFMHNLKRTHKIDFSNWLWVMEWHENGFPHYHVFIEVAEIGKAGMIGNETLLKCWKFGIIHESYIKNKAHWDSVTTYFGKAGYFDPKSNTGDKKQHQLDLPEWALNVTYRIRKSNSMIFKKDALQGDYIEDEKWIDPDEPEKIKQSKKTYREILKACGKSTYIDIWYNDNHSFWKRIECPYRDFVSFPGEYIHALGYQVAMKFNEFMLFLALWDQENLQPQN